MLKLGEWRRDYKTETDGKEGGEGEEEEDEALLKKGGHAEMEG